MPDLGTVAVLGAGLMGAPMAGRLAAAGAHVRIWNRTPARATDAAERYGLVRTPTPAEAVANTDVLLSMLLDGLAIEAAMEGADGVHNTVRPGTLWLQTSTVGTEAEARLSRIAARLGLRYVDAPVLGTSGPAANGDLVVLASGDDGDRAEALRYLEPLARRVEWSRGAGTGTRIKTVLNAWVLSLTVAMAETVALAEGMGLDPREVLDVLDGHSTEAPYARAKAAAMIARSFEPSAHLSVGHKDASLVREAAVAAGIEARLLEAVAEQFRVADQAGHGHEDLAAVYWAARNTNERNS